MSGDDDEQRNYVEARMIIQEVRDGSSVFVVGSAPFGRIWFDPEKVQKQYQVLIDNWNEEYGDSDTEHSKKPRVVKVLLEEDDPMFHTSTDKDKKLEVKEEKKEDSISDSNHMNKIDNIANTITTTNPEVKPKRKYTKRKKTEETEKKALEKDQNADETQTKTKKTRAKKTKKAEEIAVSNTSA